MGNMRESGKSPEKDSKKRKNNTGARPWIKKREEEKFNEEPETKN